MTLPRPFLDTLSQPMPRRTPHGMARPLPGATPWSWGRFALLLLLLVLLPPVQAADRASAPAQNILFIFDASGSMWAEMEGGHRITVAREVMREVIGDLPAATQAALVAYGHNRRGDCNDIETLIELGPLDKAAFIERVDAINPRGMTPITASVDYALQQLMASERAASVVLISDGLENCGGDPCAAVRAAAMDIDFKLHVVGFAMGDVDTGELQCMAEAGGGHYVAADNTRELTEALKTVLAPIAPTLAVAARLNGERIPATVHIHPADGPTSAEVATRAPREGDGPVAAALTAGTYRLIVRPEGLDWPMEQTLHDVVLIDGETTRVEADFAAARLDLTLTVDAQPHAGSVVIQSEAGQRLEIPLSAEQMPRTVWLPADQYSLTARIDEAGVEARHDALDLTTDSREARTFDFSPSRLRLGVSSHGAPLEGGSVRIVDASSGTQVIGDQGPAGWLGTNYGNPRDFVVSPGTYDVWLEGRDLQIDGQWLRGIEVGPGEIVERIVDFAPGTLSLGITHNGKPIAGRVRIVDAATETDLIRDFGSTLVGDGRGHPRPYEVPAGTYDVEFTGTDLQAAPHWLRGIEVTAGQAVEAIHDFQLGALSLGITLNGKPSAGRVRVVDAATETDLIRDFGSTLVGNGRANPRRYEVPAGTYDIRFEVSGADGGSRWLRGVTVRAGERSEHVVDVAAPE